MAIYQPTEKLPDGTLARHIAVAVLLSIPELRPHLLQFHEPTPEGLRTIRNVVAQHEWPRVWTLDLWENWPIASDALNEAAERAVGTWANIPKRWSKTAETNDSAIPSGPR